MAKKKPRYKPIDFTRPLGEQVALITAQDAAVFENRPEVAAQAAGEWEAYPEIAAQPVAVQAAFLRAVANQTIDAGTDANTKAIIEAARVWYTGQTKGGKQATVKKGSIKDLIYDTDPLPNDGVDAAISNEPGAAAARATGTVSGPGSGDQPAHKPTYVKRTKTERRNREVARRKNRGADKMQTDPFEAVGSEAFAESMMEAEKQTLARVRSENPMSGKGKKKLATERETPGVFGAIEQFSDWLVQNPDQKQVKKWSSTSQGPMPQYEEKADVKAQELRTADLKTKSLYGYVTPKPVKPKVVPPVGTPTTKPRPAKVTDLKKKRKNKNGTYTPGR